jgi:hypothetical protein
MLGICKIIRNGSWEGGGVLRTHWKSVSIVLTAEVDGSLASLKRVAVRSNRDDSDILVVRIPPGSCFATVVVRHVILSCNFYQQRPGTRSYLLSLSKSFTAVQKNAFTLTMFEEQETNSYVVLKFLPKSNIAISMTAPCSLKKVETWI